MTYEAMTNDIIKARVNPYTRMLDLPPMNCDIIKARVGLNLISLSESKRKSSCEEGLTPYHPNYFLQPQF